VNGAHDLLLSPPIRETAMRGLLFGTFLLHILFVLLTVGTAILALSYFIHAWWDNRLSELRWDKRILRMFLMHKSLAVVLGVGPLLLIQVAFTIPFFTGVTLFSPLWLLVILLLIIAFISFDSLGHKIDVHPYVHLVLGIVAMAALLAVPGFFVAVLVATEHPERWLGIVHNGFRYDMRLTLHWLFRYLHIIGASVVFGAVFHYLFVVHRHEGKRRELLRWLVLGLLVQVAGGIALYWSLLKPPDVAVYAYLSIGIVLTAMLVWLATRPMRADQVLHYGFVVPVLLLLLMVMLLTRQNLQDRGVSGVIPMAEADARAYGERLAPYEKGALERYKPRMDIVYDNGPTIYQQSCSFCHGPDGLGDGPEAGQLQVPPEALAEIRTTAAYIERIFASGMDGTAMPRFTYYDDRQRHLLIATLDSRWQVLHAPPPIEHTVTTAVMDSARKTWSNTCAGCHGTDGGGTAQSAGFKPPPPDFTQYVPVPQRAFHIITEGYPGTLMSPHSYLAADLRWGLVEIVEEKRTNGGT
jgi:mono/diheme cytochrome c family protein